MTASGFMHVLKTRVLEAVSPSEVLAERVILAVGEDGRIVTRAPGGSAAFDSWLFFTSDAADEVLLVLCGCSLTV